MNIGYIFDLNEILKEEDLHIPYLNNVHYRRIDFKELSISKIIDTRNSVMENIQKAVTKHIFFFIINDSTDSLKALERCINNIQEDRQNFNQQNYEIHVVCNFVNDPGLSIKDYEDYMPCLIINNVPVYSWILDNYDFNADKLIKVKRRAHAIARMICLVCNQSDLSDALIQMSLSTKVPMPVYNLFGDSCVFFDEEKRNNAVRDYYSFKNIQHLLNISDNELDNFIKTEVLPYAKDEKELNKRIDATSEEFFKKKGVRIPIEASIITEKTQGLLIKSADDDKEYLVNATNNKLVFVDELAQSGGWQLEGMETFLSDYQAKVGIDFGVQEKISEDFLETLYYEKYITHEREGFDRINNRVSESRKKHINSFLRNVDNHMSGFLNQEDSKDYVWLQNPLTQQETAKHRSNIDYGLAFLEYLESGDGNRLTDQQVSMGDINFTKIKEDLEKEESKRHKEFDDKKKSIEEKYLPQGDEEVSKTRKEFERIDNRIKQCLEEKRRCEYQLYHWIDGDASPKITSRSRSLIALVCGILAAGLWLYVSIEFISDLMKEFNEDYDKIQWYLFGAFIVIGAIIGAVILFNAKRRLKEAEEDLEAARQQKMNVMHLCVNEMNDITEKHYNYLLAYHGLKTMEELIHFAERKKEDLVIFRNTLFKLMIHYSLSTTKIEMTLFEDDNTFEVTDTELKNGNVNMLLFGPEGSSRRIPYCFAQEGFALSDTFNEFKRKKVRYDTLRNSFNYTSKTFDQVEIEKEIIPCMKEHENSGIKYTTLNGASILPNDETGIEMEDVHQGACGDCYFLATLAAIARINPDYIVGKNGMVEELGEDHRFFRVKFYDKDGSRVNVDIDNRFWNMDNNPHYAKKGIHSKESALDGYDPWVMAVEKAWAKVNGNGYNGIEGAREDGKEVERKVEYSFAVTGKSAFYCMTKNVTDRDKLRNMMKKHFCEDKLPITLYSFADGESQFANQYLVTNHAYALRSANDNGTFDIFNPWNSHDADEDIVGKHYKEVDINFIKDNFSVVVFFGIKEADFDSFERDLTQTSTENEVIKHIEKTLHNHFEKLNLPLKKFAGLLSEEDMEHVLTHSNYLFSKNKVNNPIGIEEGEKHLVFLEGGKSKDCKDTNTKFESYLSSHLTSDYFLQPILLRDDDKQIITIFRLSPHYLSSNFH